MPLYLDMGKKNIAVRYSASNRIIFPLGKEDRKVQLNLLWTMDDYPHQK
jgi:hypothetical protein